MPTRAANGLGAVVHEVAERTRTLVRLESELATLELRRKARALAFGIVLVVTAALLALFGIGFALATVAAALATVMPTWLALLVVTVGLLLVAGAIGMLGTASLRRGIPPVPEQAVREARLTTEAMRGNGRA
jgi:Putative Actinobacterial Holin-X, holin superfamily III